MASLIDLDCITARDTTIACDVCIVGAGAAGLYLASRLAAAGLELVILEAGGKTCQTGTSVGIESTFSDTTYRGATEGRAFGWGGSTSRWGGLLIPHSALDLRAPGAPDASSWTHIVDVVKERTAAVFSALRLGAQTDFESLASTILPSDIEAALWRAKVTTMAAEFLPFRRRNLTYLLDKSSARSVTVYLNAIASGWVVEPGPAGLGSVTVVHATSHSGSQLRVAARSFVIAAGAIESARILLEIDRVTGERMIPRTAAVGRYLSDHLSCSIASVKNEDRGLAAKLLGPVFVRGRMRSLRYVAEDDLRRLPKHFAHLIFDMDNAGFRFAKEVLFGLQTRTLSVRKLPSISRALRELSELAYHRLIHSKLHFSANTRVHLQLDIEQDSVWDNRVHLSPEIDRNGRPGAVIDWRIRNSDIGNIESLGKLLIAKWSSIPGFPRLISRDWSAGEQKPHDAYHPVGTCRMGDGHEATVDVDLKVKGSANLYVLSTGVLPGAGTANPTFTMFCLGDRLAEQLARTATIGGPHTNIRPTNGRAR